jgi:hypothetical protein
LKNWSKTHLSTAILGLLSNHSVYVPDLKSAYDPVSRQHFQLIDIKLNYDIQNVDIRDTNIRDTDIIMNKGFNNTNKISDDNNDNNINDNNNNDNNNDNRNDNNNSKNNIIMTDINSKKIKIEFTEILYTIFIKMINKYKEYVSSIDFDMNKDNVQFCITNISTVIFDNQITKLKANDDTNFQISFDEKKDYFDKNPSPVMISWEDLFSMCKDSEKLGRNIGIHMYI